LAIVEIGAGKTIWIEVAVVVVAVMMMIMTNETTTMMLTIAIIILMATGKTIPTVRHTAEVAAKRFRCALDVARTCRNTRIHTHSYTYTHTHTHTHTNTLTHTQIQQFIFGANQLG